MRIFCDMDGVLADFDTGYEKAFGVRPSKTDDNVDWELIRNTPDFYRDLPLMSDALELWGFLRTLGDPIILTGVPKSVPEAPGNKRAFASAKLPGNPQVITCPSKNKSLWCAPGDVLIDDWEKYMHLWIGAGGRWITHTSAANSIAELKGLL